MSPEQVLTLGSEAMQTTLLVAAPVLGTALIIGLVVSIFQAATQINEQTLSFIPKLVGVMAILLLAGHWMLMTLVDYMHHIFTMIPQLVN
ncbi:MULTISPECIES: flagellar biosynthesis protein FliQ [unclassified Methylophilus]|jgi:flagellar biosynthesis protein FliQ|uniref:flagellar biosynthesis protein FliQ n=1 Tax=unclassified Methylophilus TaxID=2630143 RepID=UPI00188F8ECB|nr:MULTISPECIES: flagellar biosynthesis protein FliQ [unclassified Methylophilus]MBF5038144.1 flagellar biosynthesis protein FliQ [Methylophilus sp. 13]MDF0376666.1 flagellar biosynthesis protein FliQ [Methylophilus sp. YYY-1]MDT7850564.1 flagellar biosynthesis protein FliQ [Methylophilus sp. VKM B-3414]BEV07889.1 flagellar biosynthesis protein FliQ [Methylophilus sp. DW102]